MASIRNSPCAKLTTLSTPKISVRPIAMMAYMPPSITPDTSNCASVSMIPPSRRFQLGAASDAQQGRRGQRFDHGGSGTMVISLVASLAG